MTKTSKKVKYIYAILIIVMLLGVMMQLSPATAFADVSSFSNVLDDLRVDSTFDVGLYPMNSNDYSIKLIQVAESTDNELLVYVYQPSGAKSDIRASSINISEEEGLDIKNYKLQYLNSTGVFYKYVVKDFEVPNFKVRYYFVPSIFRPFISGVDADAGNDNEISEVAFEVGKQFRFAGTAEDYSCDVIEMETITITDKFVGYVRYFDGYSLFGSGSCDSHFVAFDTDRPIDKLYEADVFYTAQEYKHVDNTKLIDWLVKDEFYYYGINEKYAYLTYKDKVEHTGAGWWGAGTYTWDRIETVEQFLSENEVTQNLYSGAVLNVSLGNKITDAGKTGLKNKKWVLRFAETKYSVNTMATSSIENYGTIVGNVSILRLKFEYDGEIYNLGVVDNKQTGTNSPVNEEKIKAELFDLFQWLEDHTGIPKWVWIAVAIMIPLGIVLSVLSIVFPPVRAVVKTSLKGIWIGAKYLFKGLWWLICLPFKGIKALIEKIRESKG